MKDLQTTLVVALIGILLGGFIGTFVIELMKPKQITDPYNCTQAYLYDGKGNRIGSRVPYAPISCQRPIIN